MIQNFRVLNVKILKVVESLIIYNNPVVKGFGSVNFNVPSSIVSKEGENSDTFEMFLERKIRSPLKQTSYFSLVGLRDLNPGPTGYEPVALAS